MLCTCIFQSVLTTRVGKIDVRKMYCLIQESRAPVYDFENHYIKIMLTIKILHFSERKFECHFTFSSQNEDFVRSYFQTWVGNVQGEKVKILRTTDEYPVIIILGL